MREQGLKSKKPRKNIDSAWILTAFVQATSINVSPFLSLSFPVSSYQLSALRMYFGLDYLISDFGLPKVVIAFAFAFVFSEINSFV